MIQTVNVNFEGRWLQIRLSWRRRSRLQGRSRPQNWRALSSILLHALYFVIPLAEQLPFIFLMDRISDKNQKPTQLSPVRMRDSLP